MGRQFWPIERTDVSAIVLPIVRAVGPEVLFIIYDHLSPPRRESSTQGTKKVLSSRESSLPISNFASQRRWKAQVVYTWQSLGSFEHQLLVNKMPNPDRQWFASSLRSLSKSLSHSTAGLNRLVLGDPCCELTHSCAGFFGFVVSGSHVSVPVDLLWRLQLRFRILILSVCTL